MSLSCPVDLDVVTLRREVTAMYANVAAAPDATFHFHRGPEYAARTLGYDADALSRLPVDVTARFAGVGNPHVIAPLWPGATVLDVGCGAGTDLLLAALRVGPAGWAIGVDMTEVMCAHARGGAVICGLTNIMCARAMPRRYLWTIAASTWCSRTASSILFPRSNEPSPRSLGS